MKSKIITLVLFLAVMAGGYIWWIWPLVYYVPGATLTIVDEVTEKPIEGVLVEVRWSAKGMEGYTLKHQWMETQADGKIEIEQQKFNLKGNNLQGLFVDLKHPLYKWYVWHTGPESMQRESQIPYSNPNPDRKIEKIKLQNYKKLLENFDGCNWDPENRKNKFENTPLNLLGDFSFYASALYRSQFPKKLNIQKIKSEIENIFSHVFHSCPDKMKFFNERLNRVEI